MQDKGYGFQKVRYYICVVCTIIVFFVYFYVLISSTIRLLSAFAKIGTLYLRLESFSSDNSKYSSEAGIELEQCFPVFTSVKIEA